MLFIVLGVLLLVVGLYLTPQQTSTTQGDTKDSIRASDALEQAGTALSPTGGADGAGFDVGSGAAQTPTTVVFPTYAPVNVLSVQLTNNVYRDAFIPGQSGWEQRYVGQDGAWNGYEQGGYAFQLGSSNRYPGGRRIWDINICCRLPSAYKTRFIANTVTPQRGMVITELQGDVFDIDSSSAIIVMFDIGYADQLRNAPVRVIQLVQGQAYDLGCTGLSPLIVSSRMEISVTVVSEYVSVDLFNPATQQHATPTCRSISGYPGTGMLGMGAVRAANSESGGLSRLRFEVFEFTEVAGVSGTVDQTPAPTYIQVRCTGEYHSSFDSWLESSINAYCLSD
jgi:hypothetical protein